MINRKQIIILLFGISIIASVIRFYQLGKVPISPDWDEASLGYNAYSILKTGRDEYGKLLPLSLQSFNDYKPPLYVYLAIPVIEVFGLSVWSVRLPSAIFGLIAVIGTFFLVREIFCYLIQFSQKTNLNKEAVVKQEYYSEVIGLLSALLLAISPWHIQFSRVAFEANIGVTLNIWGTWFLLRGLKKGKYLYASAIIFSLGLYAYHTERIFIPFLLLIFGLMFRKQLLDKKVYVIRSVLIGLVLIIPVIISIFNNTAIERLSGTTTFRKQTEVLQRSVIKLENDKANHNYLGLVLNNRRIEWAKNITSSYLSHFSLRWLFLTGDLQRHHAPDEGLLYLWELPCLAIGFIYIWKVYKRIAFLVTGWILISPLAASLTTDTPHAVRTIVFLPMFQLLTAVGIVFVYNLLKRIYLNNNLKIRIGLLVIVFFVFCSITIEVSRYFDLYFLHLNHEFSQYWQYGYEQIINYVQQNRNKYDKIVISENLEQPYIFFLFYTKYTPSLYQKTGGSYMNNFDIFEFRTINWVNEITDGKTLYIGTAKEIENPNKLLISYLDGSPAIAVADKH
jgi:4-amino-4-deoxy-L-arabinose transferase-like glycosyltransferase